MIRREVSMVLNVCSLCVTALIDEEQEVRLGCIYRRIMLLTYQMLINDILRYKIFWSIILMRC
jgi:hypothetical protein